MTAATRPFEITERVRWADVDLVGIMRFSAFTRLVELGEQEVWREVGLPYSQVFDAPEIWMPRRVLNIEYFAPARIDDLLLVRCYVSRMGETSFTLAVDMHLASTGALIAAALMTVVCVTVAAFEKRPLPAELREAFGRFVMTPADARATVGKLA